MKVQRVIRSRPNRKTDHLRKGRLSIPYARYFVTLCTEKRTHCLAERTVFEAFRGVLLEFERNGDIRFHCATLMPDHAHLLFTLGERLSLAHVITKVKMNTATRFGHDRLTWQPNYYDHRLRLDATLERFALYIFLNPYRKDLLKVSECWPYWLRHRDANFQFLNGLKDGGPPADWLPGAESVGKIIDDDLS